MVPSLPPETTDRVLADGRREFVTSDQCMPCHSGDNSPFGPNLIVEGIDVSPWAEWLRASLYYQAIPPRYLMDRFNDSDGFGTRALHYMGSRLDDSKTFFPGWKLPIGSASVTVR